MKRMGIGHFVTAAFLLLAGAAAAYAQATFKIPFKFEAGGKKYPSGTYWVGIKDDGSVEIRQEAKGLDVTVPSIGTAPQPTPPVTGPQLLFDVVGNFAPSYSEYVTDYVLAEVWMPGRDGIVIKTLKGAHQHQIIKAEQPEA
jgi:hypothetical protein